MPAGLRFEHDHAFAYQGCRSVLLQDELRFTMPLGEVGHGVSVWMLVPYIRRLMQRRSLMLKQIAESEEWRDDLPHPALIDVKS